MVAESRVICCTVQPFGYVLNYTDLEACDELLPKAADVYCRNVDGYTFSSSLLNATCMKKITVSGI